MDYSHLEFTEAKNSIQKCIITKDNQYILNIQGDIQSNSALNLPYEVTDISSNNLLSLFATTNGVYALGLDPMKYNLLGNDLTFATDFPIKVHNLTEKFIECSISTTHAGAINESGILYV